MNLSHRLVYYITGQLEYVRSTPGTVRPHGEYTMEQIEAISAALSAVNEKNVDYLPLIDEYHKAMSTSGAYEPVPDYQPAAGEKLTPDLIIAMIPTGEITKTGITNAVTAGKIRKITAQKSPALIAAETALTGALAEYDRICKDAVAKITVKKHTARSASGAAGEVGANKQADVTAAIHAMDSEATVTFEGRRVTGVLSTGASFDYDVYGQSYLTSIAKMLKA